VSNDPEGLEGDAGVDGEDAGAIGEGAGNAVEYDVSPWAGETRRILRTVLAEREIPHAWEGTVVVVPEAFEEAMDQMVDEVSSTARAALGSAREKVGYDVSPWSAATQNKLVDKLVEATIAHEWDAEGDLLVHAEDAESVEEILDELGDPDGSEEIDGLELHDRLGKLFVVVDRLANDPQDSTGVRGIEQAYGAIESAGLPFGVDAALWLDIHKVAGRLRDTVDDVASGVPGAMSFTAAEEPDDAPAESHDPDADGEDNGESDAAGTEGPSDSGADRTVTERPSVERLANELREMLRRLV